MDCMYNACDVSLQHDWKPAGITDSVQRTASCSVWSRRIAAGAGVHTPRHDTDAVVSDDKRTRRNEHWRSCWKITVPEVGRCSGLWRLLTNSSLWLAVQG